MTTLPPAVRVHGLAHIQQLQALARPCTLLSAPGAALSWGCLWWQALLNEAAYTGPALLDCADAPGRAIEALELGLKGVCLAPCPAWAEIAGLAAGKHALLLTAPPPCLDLASPHAPRQLAVWLFL